MATVIYHNGTMDQFPVISRAQVEAMAHEMAHQMGTKVRSVWFHGVRY